MKFQHLKTKQRQRRGEIPQELDLRVHRAISWIGRAEREEHDPDVRFVFLWIAFNAAYADGAEDGFRPTGDRRRFLDMLERLVELDSGARLERAVLERFQGPVRALLQNRHVFRPFWLHQSGAQGHSDWAASFKRSGEQVVAAIRARNTPRVLGFIFDRLYVLRCQIMHGSTTWNGSVNREQVSDGAAILADLVPIMIDMMLDNPEEDWGSPLYPVVGPRKAHGGSSIRSRQLG